jgi:hypothetical protein
MVTASGPAPVIPTWCQQKLGGPAWMIAKPLPGTGIGLGQAVIGPSRRASAGAVRSPPSAWTG